MGIQINIPEYGNIFFVADTFADLANLRTAKVRDGYAALIKGRIDPADNEGGVFFWHSGSTAQASDVSIVPADGSTGRWLGSNAQSLNAGLPVSETLKFLSATAADADSYNKDGGKTGLLGFYKTELADGSIVYKPSLSLLRPNGVMLTKGTFEGNGGRPAQFGDQRVFVTTQAATGSIGISYSLHSYHAPTGADRYAVALYALGVGHAGTGDVWGTNFASFIQADAPAQSNHFACELDQNNSAGHYGDSPFTFTGPDGFFEAAPLKIVAAGPNRSTAGIMIGSTGGQLLNRGIAIHGDSIKTADIQIGSNSPTILLTTGAHANGIDFSRVTGMSNAFIAPYGAKITQLRADGSPVSTYGTADQSIHMGDGALVIRNHCPFVPSADNAFTLGGNGARWSTVWAATSTISTSDPDMKTDVRSLPSMISVVEAIDPKVYRFRIGGNTVEEYDTVELTQATETVERNIVEIEMVDGKAVQKSRIVTEEMPAFDDVPVEDENGEPVMIHVAAQSEEVDEATGKILCHAVAERWDRRTHRAPRMVEKTVKRKRTVSREGVREHFGFLADDDFKAVMDATGLDFGGYIVGEDGVRGLRYEELIPALWKAVQELSAEVKMLKAA